MATSAAPLPSLTLIVPAYQVEAYLPACLSSILADAPLDLQVVVVNDAATDGTREIIGSWQRQDPRVTAVHLPANVGLGRARNAGLARARGDYIWFVDGDDWLPAGAIAAVQQRLAQFRPDVLIVDHAEVWDDGRIAVRPSAGQRAGAPVPLRLADRPQLLRLAQSACTKIVRRAYLTDSGLSFQPGWYEDCSFSHPLLIGADRIDLLDQVCYAYRQRASGGITRTVSDRHWEVFAQYERLFATTAAEAFHPELFRLMVNHLLVILGNDQRLPAAARREFFARIVQEYRRRLPADGYPVPGGALGVKHRMVRDGAYLPYAAMRTTYRLVGAVRRGLSRRRQPTPSAELTALVAPAQPSTTPRDASAIPAPRAAAPSPVRRRSSAGRHR